LHNLSNLKLIGNSAYKDVELNFDVSYDKLPAIDSTNNYTIFLRSGITNKIPHEDIVPKFIYQPHGNNTLLSEVSISRYIFKDIIFLLTNNGLFNYTINDNNLFNESPFDLNVNFLANVIPEITNAINPLKRIYIKNKITQIIFNENVKDKFVINAVIETGIFILENSSNSSYSENEVFKFQQNFFIEIKPQVNFCKINFYFDKIQIENVKIISENFNEINFPMLNSYLKSYYNLFFEKFEKFYLLKNDIDLSESCNNIQEFCFTEYGFDFLAIEIVPNFTYGFSANNKNANKNFNKFWIDNFISKSKKTLKFLREK